MDLTNSVIKIPAHSNAAPISHMKKFEHDSTISFITQSPAAMKDPLPIAALPWLLIVIPRFSRVPPNTVYIVAICRVVAFLAALSDYQKQVQ